MIRYLLVILLVAIPAAARSAEFDPRSTPDPTPVLIARVVAYVITLERCGLVKPGRNARAPWDALRTAYRGQPERWARDETPLRSHIRAEIGRARLTMPEPAEGWCQAARRGYGTRGQIYPDAIAMRDGSFSGTRVNPDILDVYHY
jgi:hypothetical protein